MSDHTIDSNNQQQEFSNHIIRVKHNRDNPYVMLNKQAIWDENLSLDTIGLWTRLMTRPDNWQLHVCELMKSCKLGRDKIRRMLKELIDNGYAVRLQDRQTGKRKNQFAGHVWYLLEFKATPEEIKKMFPQTGFPSPEVPSPENPQLINNPTNLNVCKESNDNIYATAHAVASQSPSSLSDATKKKKVPFRSVCLVERVPNHPSLEEFKKYFNRPLVGISDKDHEALVAKHGNQIVETAYINLAEWKLSKAEADPKAVTTHTDLRRLQQWGIKAAIENPVPVSNLASKRKWAIAIDKKKDDKADLKYALGSKAERVEEAIAMLYNKKNDLKPESFVRKILWKLTNRQVDELEAELEQMAENKG